MSGGLGWVWGVIGCLVDGWGVAGDRGCVVGVGQGGLCVVKSGGKVCICGFGVVRKERSLAQLPCEQRTRSHMGVMGMIV